MARYKYDPRTRILGLGYPRAADWAHQRQPKGMIHQLADEDAGLVPDVAVFEFERGARRLQQQQGKFFLDLGRAHRDPHHAIVPLRSGLPQPGAAAEAAPRKKIDNDKYS